MITSPTPTFDPALIAHIAPDVVFLDWMFGAQPSGARLVEQLRAHPATRDIPLVVCTAATKSIETLADDPILHNVTVLHKPFEIDQLLEAVAHVTPANFAALPFGAYNALPHPPATYVSRSLEAACA